jgi:RimJ/RimL family protein N-acetyltransferase
MFGGTIRGKAMVLRTPREDDLASVNAWMADMRVRRFGQLWAEPAAPATWKERLAEAAKDEGNVLWSLDAAGRIAGTVRIGLHWNGPGAYIQHFVLDPELWGRGFGGDAALALHRYVFDYLDRKIFSCEAVADNVAALRIAERLGYRELGRGHTVHYRDGSYVDEVSLRLVRETWDERWSSEREYAPFAEGIGR